ncbi:hypothetical protein Sru01_33310 [Sphaerisporangium rufum]|uniref:YbaB/EbfC family DNA-binding protein n=1 Tax=Sphaerisporangium rufum TaxID=1381558 RepID=A0A919R2E6_9ACTN|nr:YbaB/EbfC family nucleoid-associated protein [Sphaerisporangium rufum]GII78349.1 hypothetical protein Sru01_33310 [Sphaerisporangium rufum]
MGEQLDAFARHADGDVPGLLAEVEQGIERVAAVLRDQESRGVEVVRPDGVAVTVTGTGALLTVTISARAMRDLDHVALADAVRAAIGEARERAGQAFGAAVTEAAGPVGAVADPLEPYFRALGLRE